MSKSPEFSPVDPLSQAEAEPLQPPSYIVKRSDGSTIEDGWAPYKGHERPTGGGIMLQRVIEYPDGSSTQYTKEVDPATLTPQGQAALKEQMLQAQANAAQNTATASHNPVAGRQ